MPLESFFSRGFTRWDGSTWAPLSVVLMYGVINCLFATLGMLMLMLARSYVQVGDCFKLHDAHTSLAQKHSESGVPCFLWLPSIFAQHP